MNTMIEKLDFIDFPDLIEEAQKINHISMNAARTVSGTVSWTNPKSGKTYAVSSGGEKALVKKIIQENYKVFGILDFVGEINNKLDKKSGASDLRPSNVSVGDIFFDVTLGKPIWWNGTVWIDSNGATI